MRDQERDRERMAYQSLVDLPLNESRSSQLTGLGAGIPSLVGAFGSKVRKLGAGSSLSTSSGSRGSLSYQESFGGAREDGLDREAMLMPIFSR